MFIKVSDEFDENCRLLGLALELYGWCLKVRPLRDRLGDECGGVE